MRSSRTSIAPASCCWRADRTATRARDTLAPVNELSIAPQRGEPLAAWFSAESRSSGVTEQRFECASHGDRVTGLWWRPESGIPPRCVLAVHDLSASKQADAIVAAARMWAGAGYATAAIDLPLHGERHNAKLSPRAVAAAASSASPDRGLWRGLLSQAVRDLARTLDALATRGPLPPVACVGFGDAAAVARAYARLDPRIRLAAGIGAIRVSGLEEGGPATKPLLWLARPDDLHAAWRDDRA